LSLAAADHSQACQDPVKINWLNFTGQSSIPDASIGPGNNLWYLVKSDQLEAGQDPVKTIRKGSPAKAPFLMHRSDRETKKPIRLHLTGLPKLKLSKTIQTYLFK
jgi:hypothetical protein